MCSFVRIENEYGKGWDGTSRAFYSRAINCI